MVKEIERHLSEATGEIMEIVLLSLPRTPTMLPLILVIKFIFILGETAIMKRFISDTKITG